MHFLLTIRQSAISTSLPVSGANICLQYLVLDLDLFVAGGAEKCGTLQTSTNSPEPRGDLETANSMCPKGLRSRFNREALFCKPEQRVHI
jgi:hypothetical protein